MTVARHRIHCILQSPTRVWQPEYPTSPSCSNLTEIQLLPSIPASPFISPYSGISCVCHSWLHDLGPVMEARRAGSKAVLWQRDICSRSVYPTMSAMCLFFQVPPIALKSPGHNSDSRSWKKSHSSSGCWSALHKLSRSLRSEPATKPSLGKVVKEAKSPLAAGTAKLRCTIGLTWKTYGRNSICIDPGEVTTSPVKSFTLEVTA